MLGDQAGPSQNVETYKHRGQNIRVKITVVEEQRRWETFGEAPRFLKRKRKQQTVRNVENLALEDMIADGTGAALFIRISSVFFFFFSLRELLKAGIRAHGEIAKSGCLSDGGIQRLTQKTTKRMHQY